MTVTVLAAEDEASEPAPGSERTGEEGKPLVDSSEVAGREKLTIGGPLGMARK